MRKWRTGWTVKPEVISQQDIVGVLQHKHHVILANGTWVHLNFKEWEEFTKVFNEYRDKGAE